MAAAGYKVVGTRPIRPDGVEKVTGKAQYGADIRLPGMIYGRVLRSPHAHARILSIDTSAAEAVPGVLAVVTGKDIPLADDVIRNLGEGAVNFRDLRDNVLASEKALYEGHAIVGVAATSAHAAGEAIEKIVVRYEVLPALLDVREAMRPEAPVLDDRRRTKDVGGEVGDAPTNVASHIRFQGGDTAAAFAEADEVVEREYTTSTFHQGYIEPNTATASWNADGTVTVWTSTQGAFGIRSQLAELLRMPLNRIRVIPLEIGGGFGGKINVYLEPVAALLSKKSGRPVKMAMDRAEVFRATGPTSGTAMRVKAARKGGRLTAVEASLAFEAGAFPGSPVAPGAMCMLGPYDIENFVIDGYDVVLNKPRTSPYRAPGSPQSAFAIEQAIDELAKGAGLDPLEFRLANASHEGSRQVTGVAFGSIGNEECLRAAVSSPHYKAPIEGPNRGRGVASGFWFNGGMQSSVIVSVAPDGTVNLTEGSTDIGGTRASLSMQLAETLGVSYDDIHAVVADTDSVPHNDITGGSRTTFATGIAVHEAGLEIQREMVARAAKQLEVAPDSLCYADGVVSGSDGKQLTFKEIAAAQARTGGPIMGRGSVSAKGVGAAFATHIVDVEVDPDTGKVEILRYTAVQDVGTAIHPSYVEGQIQGGVAQGIGAALNEEYYYDEAGHLNNASFLDYRMPTTLDLPNIETILVEVFNPGHPYGVRGVGEVPIVPPLAAVANAIADATGHRFTALPISARRITEELGAE